MMLGTSSSSLIATDASAAAAAAAAAAEAHDSGGGSTGGSGEVGGAGTVVPGGGFSDEEKGRIEEGERGASGGNRWPRQETLALLKIRSEMGLAFRDSSLKGPLWEQVSRKMAELGYQRSSKKCKEKFENVYKYHKRTKDGRASKPDGKTYRFFEQLEALESSPSLQLPPQPRQQSQAAVPMATTAMAVQMPATTNPPIASHITVSSPNPVSFSPSVNNPIISSLPSSQPQLPPQLLPSTNPPQSNSLPISHLNISTSLLSDSTSSSTSSDEDIGRRHKRKRKFKDFFERLMKEVIDKQEELQRRFLETLEKRERDRMIREEAWRVQEMARMNRELDLLAQERSMATAKDTAVMQFLQKITGQQPNLQTPITNVPLIPIPVHLHPPENPSPQPISVSLPHTAAAAPTAAAAAPAPTPPAQATAVTQVVAAAAPALTPTRNADTSKTDHNGGENFMTASSSRWPKAEVQALIRLRTNLDVKYQESGPKGPLWEEISAGMNKVGYNRSAKRCKEKWENINKYFKKVKESNKKRPEDSKTCPYFHQLEALYKEKAKSDVSYNSSYANAIKPENPMVPIMARPEQQWPLPQDHQHGGGHHQQDTSPMDEDHDHESDNMDQNDHDQDDDDVDDDDEEDEGGGYEMVTNKASSVAKTTAE